MLHTLPKLLQRLGNENLLSANVIPWSSPIPSFGDLSKSKVATLGLNPSNREFVDIKGVELDCELRRFHTLKSLDLKHWTEVDEKHLKMITDSCCKYFLRNPYDSWFKSLDYLISGTKTSYYDNINKACHLDLIPYATALKWSRLLKWQRTLLMNLAGDTLGMLLRESPVQILVLNGKTVVDNLQQISGVHLQKKEISSWTLPRKSGAKVKGHSYIGIISEISGIKLKRKIRVLGFNHNIQSSFGVTNRVRSSIKNWITRSSKEAI